MRKLRKPQRFLVLEITGELYPAGEASEVLAEAVLEAGLHLGVELWVELGVEARAVALLQLRQKQLDPVASELYQCGNRTKIGG